MSRPSRDHAWRYNEGLAVILVLAVGSASAAIVDAEVARQTPTAVAVSPGHDTNSLSARTADPDLVAGSND